MKKQFKWLLFPLLALALLMLIWEQTASTIIFLNIIFAYFTTRFGLKFPVWGLLLFAISCGFACETQTAIFVVLYSLPPYILGAILFKKGKLSTTLICSSLAELAVLTGHTIFVADKLMKKPAELLFGGTMEAVRHSFDSSGIANLGQGLDIDVFMNQFLSLMQMMLPCFYIIFALICMYLLFAIVRFLLEKEKIHLVHMPRFSELYLPRSISNIFIVLFLFSMFINSPILTNVISVMYTLHIFCGLSVIDFLLIKKRLPTAFRVLLLGFILSLLSALGGLTTTILCCLGMNESIRAVRK